MTTLPNVKISHFKQPTHWRVDGQSLLLYLRELDLDLSDRIGSGWIRSCIKWPISAQKKEKSREGKTIYGLDQLGCCFRVLCRDAHACGRAFRDGEKERERGTEI